MTELHALYSSPWVPSPLIEACGFVAHHVSDLTDMNLTHAARASTEGACPWCRAFSRHAVAMQPAVTILATTCDQMRRCSETLSDDLPSPAFILTVPSTNTVSALKLYESELRRLAACLTRISGITPTEESLRAAVSRLDVSRTSQPESCDAAVPICLLGNHLPVPIADFLTTLRRFGGSVVVDGLETGSRCYYDTKCILSSRGADAMISALAESCFSSIKDVARRPNSDFYRWLAVEIKKQTPKGILLVRNSWCDLWAIEAVRLRNHTELPLLELEFASTDLPASSLSRIEAFIETCKS